MYLTCSHANVLGSPLKGIKRDHDPLRTCVEQCEVNLPAWWRPSLDVLLSQSLFVSIRPYLHRQPPLILPPDRSAVASGWAVGGLGMGRGARVGGWRGRGGTHTPTSHQRCPRAMASSEKIFSSSSNPPALTRCSWSNARWFSSRVTVCPFDWTLPSQDSITQPLGRHAHTSISTLFALIRRCAVNSCKISKKKKKICLNKFLFVFWPPKTPPPHPTPPSPQWSDRRGKTRPGITQSHHPRAESTPRRSWQWITCRCGPTGNAL